jgi:iron complex transport system ATP-binding protein
MSPDATPTDVLRLEHVSVAYPRGRTVVREVSLQIRRGSFVAIVGPNGCGKSTLLRAIGRLLPVAEGAVVFDGRDVRERSPRELARSLGILPQASVAPEGMRVADLVSRGRHPHRRPFAAWTDADETAVREAMDATGVSDLATRDVDALSGGQRQRVWLAMALAQDTHTLLLDEPTTYLDIAHQLDALDLFERINREQGRTVIAVLHDLNHAARYADRLIALKDGRVHLDGAPADVLTASAVEEVFALPCRVVTDPEAGTPLIVPRRRRA